MPSDFSIATEREVLIESRAVERDRAVELSKRFDYDGIVAYVNVDLHLQSPA